MVCLKHNGENILFWIHKYPSKKEKSKSKDNQLYRIYLNSDFVCYLVPISFGKKVHNHTEMM